jgi:hypothetical protein
MPLLRPPGSRAPASAPVNPEGATDGQQPDEPGEILTFGDPERGSRLLPGSIRRPAIATAAAGIVIGGLALAVAVLALRGATSWAPATTRTQRPPAIGVLIDSPPVSFPLKGTPGALLQVQYLQTGDGSAAIWVTLAASGLPRDTYYTATAGDCVSGHPRVLASASSSPDPYTDMLILPLTDLPASVATESWIKVTNTPGTDLGGARGSFLMPGEAGRAVPTLPGRPVCP